MARPPRMSCCPRTTRCRRSGSPIRTTSTATTWPRVPTRQASGCHCRSTRTVSSRARRSARPSGRVERQFREFKGNVAHSNYDGFMFDRNINANNTFGVTGNAHMPKENPADPNSKTLETVFEDFTAYKNRNGGIWGRGEMHVFRNVKLADNAMGFTHASGSLGRDPFTSKVVDSLFVGETENIGNPRTPAEKAYGRSLPKPQMPDFPIRGYEYYDYRHDVVNVTFRELRGQRHPQDGSDLLPDVYQLRGQHRKRHRAREIHQRQAGVFPADGAQVGQRQFERCGLEGRGVPRQGRLGRRYPRFLHPHQRRRLRQHRNRHDSL